MLKIKYTGVSLLEMLIVMAIFTVVSAGVINLSVNSIEHSRDQMAMSAQAHLLNEVHDYLKRDLRSALFVNVHSGGGTACPNAFYVMQMCSTATPPANITGNMLDIVKIDSSTSASTTFKYIRYEFRNIDYSGNANLLKLIRPGGVGPNTLGSLIRMERTGTINQPPSYFWPKHIVPPSNASCTDALGNDHDANFPAMPSYASITTALATGDKIFNYVPSTLQPHEIKTGKLAPVTPFTAIYGEKYEPSLANEFYFGQRCSYFIKNILLKELYFTNRGTPSRYDNTFGSIESNPVDISFEITSGIKFF